MASPAGSGVQSLHPVESALLEAWPLKAWADTRALIAVSGGADSVALLRAMQRLSPQPNLLDVAHFNHGWRGKESDRDEQFVRELGQRLGLRVHVGRTDKTTVNSMRQSEEQARQTRYSFLTQIAYQVGARLVITAHTADDKVETILHNLFRGSGISGISSLKLDRPLSKGLLLIRPWYQVTREQIVDYLAELRQTFCEDSSNADVGLRRNFLRHSLLPMIRQEYGAGVDDRLLAFGNIASDIERMLDQRAEDYLSRVAELLEQKNETPISTESSLAIPNQDTCPEVWPVVHQALKKRWLAKNWPLGKMRRQHWSLIRDLYEQPESRSSGILLSKNCQIVANLPGKLQLGFAGSWVVVREMLQVDDHQ